MSFWGCVRFCLFCGALWYAYRLGFERVCG